MAIRSGGPRDPFPLLVGGFVAQVAGRLVDLRWHATHDEFEGGIEQVQAHWLIWLATGFVIAVSASALRSNRPASGTGGYMTVAGANVAYAAVAVVHFLQHLDRLEVDWAHLLLFATNVIGVAGVVWVVIARGRGREGAGAKA